MNRVLTAAMCSCVKVFVPYMSSTAALHLPYIVAKSPIETSTLVIWSAGLISGLISKSFFSGAAVVFTPQTHFLHLPPKSDGLNVLDPQLGHFLMLSRPDIFRHVPDFLLPCRVAHIEAIPSFAVPEMHLWLSLEDFKDSHHVFFSTV